MTIADDELRRASSLRMQLLERRLLQLAGEKERANYERELMQARQPKWWNDELSE